MNIGPRIKKSLQVLTAGPLALPDDKRTYVRYRNLEKKGLCQGVGIRVVTLTKLGRSVLNG